MKSAPKALGAALAVLALLGLALAYAAWWPRGRPAGQPEGYAPLRDDALAARWCPRFVDDPAFGAVSAVYYRAARDATGRTFLAFHPAWPHEENPGPGLGPLASRLLYTGGLGLQRAMFGPGDIEVVSLELDPSGALAKVEYETAKDYDPRAFGVEHASLVARPPLSLPLVLRVVSWNHLFSLEGPGTAPAGGASAPAPAYFSPELWASYAMVKDPETLLRKSRAHFAWEEASAQ